MDTIQILNEVFQQVFDDDGIQITRATTADDIDAWDSLTHINLAMAIEQRFKIRFALFVGAVMTFPAMIVYALGGFPEWLVIGWYVAAVVFLLAHAYAEEQPSRCNARR